MYRERTRDKYSAEQLKEIYSYDHDSSVFPDHVLRVQETKKAFEYLRTRELNRFRTAADLSCGDARIPRTYFIRNNLTLGDINPRKDLVLDIIGPIEETVDLIEPVDVFFLLETLEHLDIPEQTLYDIREKTDHLILSTPCMQWRDENPEHYWCWDFEAVEDMLLGANFIPKLWAITEPAEGYRFQIWVCS